MHKYGTYYANDYIKFRAILYLPVHLFMLKKEHNNVE